MAFIAGAAVVSVAAGAGAQQRGPSGVPAGFMPPAGMCRVWFDGVAPGRQPAPTDCVTARAQLRPNSRLVYGAALRTGDPRGTYGNGTAGTYGDAGRYDPRDSRDDDRRYDRMSDRQRHEMEKDRRKREKEREKAWKKAHKHHGRHDADDEDDDDDDDRGGDRRGRGSNAGVYGQGGVNRGGTYDPRTGNRGPCVDANHDGVCDPQQGSGSSRVRIP